MKHEIPRNNLDDFFQLAELHIYIIPKAAWQGQRNLAQKTVVEDCISVGFVRYMNNNILIFKKIKLIFF